MMPEGERTLSTSPNTDQHTACITKMQEPAVMIQQRKDNQNILWSHLALVRYNITLMNIKKNCMGTDGYGG